MDKATVELLARRAGLDKALAEFPDDVAAAAEQAGNAVARMKAPTDPRAEPWPPMRAGERVMSDLHWLTAADAAQAIAAREAVAGRADDGAAGAHRPARPEAARLHPARRRGGDGRGPGRRSRDRVGPACAGPCTACRSASRTSSMSPACRRPAIPRSWSTISRRPMRCAWRGCAAPARSCSASSRRTNSRSAARASTCRGRRRATRGTRPSSRRLVVGLGRRRRRRAVPAGARQRHRRQRAQPGQRLRHRRAEADLWPGVAPRRLSAVLYARPCRAADPHRRRQRADARGHRRPRSARSRQRRRARRALREPGSERGVRGLRIGFIRHFHETDLPADPGGGGRAGAGRARRCRRRAPRSATSACRRSASSARSTGSSCRARPGRSTARGCASGPAITASWRGAACCPGRSSAPAITCRRAPAARDDRGGRGGVARGRCAAVRQRDGPAEPDRGRRGDRAHLSAAGAHAVQRHRPPGAGDDGRSVVAAGCRCRCSSSAAISPRRRCSRSPAAWERAAGTAEKHPAGDLSRTRWPIRTAISCSPGEPLCRGGGHCPVQSPLGEAGEVDFRVSLAHRPRRKALSVQSPAGAPASRSRSSRRCFRASALAFSDAVAPASSATEVSARSFRRRAPTDPINRLTCIGRP